MLAKLVQKSGQRRFKIGFTQDLVNLIDQRLVPFEVGGSAQNTPQHQPINPALAPNRAPVDGETIAAGARLGVADGMEYAAGIDPYLGDDSLEQAQVEIRAAQNQLDIRT